MRKTDSKRIKELIDEVRDQGGEEAAKISQKLIDGCDEQVFLPRAIMQKALGPNHSRNRSIAESLNHPFVI